MKPERQEYEGHRIELREREDKLELRIDNALVQYGQLPNGQYFLHDYAYEWSDDLMEVAQRFIDHLDRTEKVRRGSKSGKKGGK
jgi:hypothetical protein